MFSASFDSKMGCLCSIFYVKKQGKPIWEVRMRNWKLREGESRLSGLLEGISIASLGKVRRQGESSITFVQVRYQLGNCCSSGPMEHLNCKERSDFRGGSLNQKGNLLHTKQRALFGIKFGNLKLQLTEVAWWEDPVSTTELYKGDVELEWLPPEGSVKFYVNGTFS
ncbi:hypothetical protein GQ457_07G001290 [Hibiscus cannabinus]